MHILETTRMCARAGAMLLLLLAAMSKLTDLGAFRSSLATWTLLPLAFRDATTMLVPCVELLIAGLWVMGVRRALMAMLAGGLVALFTGAYIVHWLYLQPPTCNCFSQIVRFEDEKAGAIFVVTRNAILLLALAWGSGWPRLPSAPSGQPPLTAVARGRAFTLVETLLVIGLVGVLLSLLLPVLSTFRMQAKDVTNVSRLREHARVFSAYAAENRDSWPCFTDPHADFTWLRSDDAAYKAQYFDAVWTWPIALARSHYQLSWRDPVFRDANAPNGFTPFWMTGTLLAHPDFWGRESRTGPDQWGHTLTSTVLFPSSKALFVHIRFANPAKQHEYSVRFALCDGSASLIPPSTLLPGYPSGAGPWPGVSWLNWAPPGMCTIDGLRGRDRQ